MPINGTELLNAAEIVAKQRNFKVAVKCTAAGTALTGVTTMVGGLVLGPIGLLVGGVTGGVVGYAATKGKFKPLHEVIANDLTYAERNQLIEHLRLALKDFDITDVMNLAKLILISNGSVETAIASAISSYFNSQSKYSLTS